MNKIEHNSKNFLTIIGEYANIVLKGGCIVNKIEHNVKNLLTIGKYANIASERRVYCERNRP